MMRLNHVHFAADSAEKVAAFYERYFSFHVKARLGKTWVMENEDRFLLAVDEKAETPTGGNRPFHFGFSLEDPKEVRALFEKMQSEAIPFRAPLQSPSENALHFYCLDPAGNELEIGWYRFTQSADEDRGQ